MINEDTIGQSKNSKDLDNNVNNDEDVLILTEKDFRYYNDEPDIKCQGFTLKGKHCANKVCKNQIYCKRHCNKFRLHKPEECPVCMDSLENVHVPLSCSHWVHRECIVQWGKSQCPVCRANIKLTAKEKKTIENNRKPPEDDGDFGGFEDEIEYPSVFFEYLRAMIRTVAENYREEDIDSSVVREFMLIEIEEIETPEGIHQD